MMILVVVLVLLALVLAWLAHRAYRAAGLRPDPFGEKFPNPVKPPQKED